jgi:diadenosine tetraphosphate (Ap4A) HIT family hydrolase
MINTYIFNEPDEVVILDKIIDDQNYKKYKVKCVVTGEMIISITNDEPRDLNLVHETYEEYKIKMASIDPLNYKWIHNIIDGLAEQESIMFQDDKIIIIPTFTWNQVDQTKFHLLTIPKDKTIRSIRDLTQKDVPLLTHIMDKTIEIIKSKYGISKEQLKMYIHYSPSTWHLHIHFCQINDTSVNSSVERSHELSTVIFNLNICSDYYKLLNILSC